MGSSDALFICLAIDEAIEGDHCSQAKAAVSLAGRCRPAASLAHGSWFWYLVHGGQAPGSECGLREWKEICVDCHCNVVAFYLFQHVLYKLHLWVSSRSAFRKRIDLVAIELNFVL